jgi:hypothetical protein
LRGSDSHESLVVLLTGYVALVVVYKLIKTDR